MAIQVARVATGVRDVAGAQTAAAISVADAAVSAALEEGIYRIVAVTASIVRIGAAVATGGENWPVGTIEYRWVSSGQQIACAAG
jgi:hypothetical protein